MDIVELLQSYNPSNPDEQISKRRMIDLLNSRNNPFLRTNMPGHFTASAFVLNKNLTKFLLMHHVKLDKWIQVGGHADGETNLLNVALKEANEESGIKDLILLSDTIFDIDVHLIPSNDFEEAHFHYDVRFLIKSFEDDNLKKNNESNELIWVPLYKNDYYEFNLENSVLRMIEKARAYSEKFNSKQTSFFLSNKKTELEVI